VDKGFSEDDTFDGDFPSVDDILQAMKSRFACSHPPRNTESIAERLNHIIGRHGKGLQPLNLRPDSFVKDSVLLLLKEENLDKISLNTICSKVEEQDCFLSTRGRELIKQTVCSTFNEQGEETNNKTVSDGTNGKRQAVLPPQGEKAAAAASKRLRMETMAGEGLPKINDIEERMDELREDFLTTMETLRDNFVARMDGLRNELVQAQSLWSERDVVERNKRSNEDLVKMLRDENAALKRQVNNKR
jgi:hypothetical protein